jgi:Toxin SymE, type I toxin-antitoxin system
MENKHAKQQAQAQLGSSGRRTLTVSTLFRQWGEGHRKNECTVPSIRLNGKWLAALGIAPGQKIRVITKGSIITIAPVAFDRELCGYAK